ncbi:hypothetical protein JRQ81_007373 [Phrynocephalus forsythii]|uniref:Rho GTPase activating protein 20 n=1 Tax=Phrynocephalus forsythii TaxID=171643 RepID=A0A9Q0XDB2_9SAUR|nr:hypothetical protein JRQ81_007373 [Phrynocephalus forsythii]
MKGVVRLTRMSSCPGPGLMHKVCPVLREVSVAALGLNSKQLYSLPFQWPQQLCASISFMQNAVVAVSNMDTADGVIKMATQQLGLPGRPNDYHLWVISGRDQPDYPLIGHEHPFSIVLRCLRDSADQLQGASDHTLLVDEYGISALEQLPRGRQCQFVLKPRPHASVQLRRDIFQKHTRRKKSLIDWALRRSTSTPTGSPASQSPTNPRKLFGLSLTSVCADGSLPKPIMDILQLLYHEGPSTRGIFRRSANAKTCKELKEKLNSGDDVQVDGESVFVAAAVITDFLRNIPDSVLSSDMHGLWMEAMDKENRVHKVDAVKRLVNRLPEANRLLLRHLFGVLHHIQQNATENQMNASNLALCIAPNMLWLPSPTGPQEESKATQKVAMLVQFLIENSSEVFGGDVASLFQRPERKKSKSVDDLLVQRNDSSDDMESAASYQGRAGERYGLDPEDILFGPSAELLLDEHREDWDLFREITACYQSQTGKDASADSYDLLEGEGGSFCSAGSLCSLSPARDRCSSEPSVCLSSQLLPPDHEPVARQSSCDATIMRSHGDYIRRLKELQLESQKLLDEGLSPSLDRARKGGFWRSPQSSHGARKPGPPRVSLSNRSSFSSLSSPATSPSASSLSSLDSAFSYCSESSALSPAGAPSLSFMFGPSAQLQASLSPKVAKRSLKEWPKPLVSPLPLGPGHVDFCVETQAGGQEGSGCSQGEKGVSVPISAPGSPPEEVSWDEGGTEPWHMETLARPLGISGSIHLGSTAHSLGGQRSPLVSRAAQRERSVKHIEIKSPEVAPHTQEGLKRTKITVYMAPKERSRCASPVGPEEEDMAVSSQSLSSGTLCQRLPRSPQATRVHIPQTVFYGQNTPLVLQSTSRRYHREPVSQTSEVSIARSPLLAKESGGPLGRRGTPPRARGAEVPSATPSGSFSQLPFTTPSRDISVRTFPRSTAWLGWRRWRGSFSGTGRSG